MYSDRNQQLRSRPGIISLVFVLAWTLFPNHVQAQPPTSGLLGYWGFDEGVGTVA